jgi:transcriptional regulator with XRE-family HTH domain
MSLKDLKKVQDAGWLIIASDDGGVLARCPSHGCGLKVRIPYGTNVQSCDPGLSRSPTDMPVGSFEDLRLFLQSRREELGLSISEIESISGLSVDHVAKAEKENPARLPNVDTVIYWANALGFEVVLRPAELSAMALRIIAETRPLQPRRRKLYQRAAHRRKRPSLR